MNAPFDIIAQRVKAFQEVRDLPYRINLQERAQDQSCVGKAEKLAVKLLEVGMASRLMCCRFSWKDLALPQELVACAPARPKHFYLQVYVPERQEWIKVDPTWDPAMENFGFKIAQWDGRRSTELAVKSLGDLSVEESATTRAVYEAALRLQRNEFRKISGTFYDGLNSYLASCRRGLEEPHA